MALTTNWRREAVTAAEQVPVAADAAQAAVVAAGEAKRLAVQAEKAARSAAVQAEAELRDARALAATWVAAAEAQLESVLADLRDDTERPSISSRGPARLALHGPDLLAGLGELSIEDGHVQSLHIAWQNASRVVRDVGTVGLVLDESEPIVVAADALECKAWRALLERVQTCAGER